MKDWLSYQKLIWVNTYYLNQNREIVKIGNKIRFFLKLKSSFHFKIIALFSLDKFQKRMIFLGTLASKYH